MHSGELPDIQIKLKELIDPLQALYADSVVAEHVFLALVKAACASLLSDSSGAGISGELLESIHTSIATMLKNCSESDHADPALVSVAMQALRLILEAKAADRAFSFSSVVCVQEAEKRDELKLITYIAEAGTDSCNSLATALRLQAFEAATTTAAFSCWRRV